MTIPMFGRVAGFCALTMLAACGNEEAQRSLVDAAADGSQSAPLLRVDVTPELLDFGRVEAGTTVSGELTVNNNGDVLVEITEVTVPDASDEFLLSSDLMEQLPWRLAPGESLALEVVYAPDSDGSDEVPLTVEYRSAVDLELWQEQSLLRGNVGVPCLSIDGVDDLAFGDTLMDESLTRRVTLRNCSTGAGAVDLELQSLGLVELDGVPSSTAFRLVGVPVIPTLLAPGAELLVDVVFTPRVLEQQERAWLEVVSSDTVLGPQLYELEGRGTTNRCPEPVVWCSASDGSAPATGRLNAQVLDTVQCNSDGTSDPDGDAIEGYEWSLERPDASGTTLVRADGRQTSFFVDVTGTYVLRLNVTDERGKQSCEPASVIIEARREEDIAIELFWTTPGDEDNTDEGIGQGSDMDLHFLNRARGCWNDVPWDCHWRNKSPYWNPTGSPLGNPAMELDDSDGGGPEVVTLSAPDALTYGVGVEYYDDQGYGPSVATVRIYFAGELAFEGSRELTQSKEFWEVADIDWTTRTVVPLNVLHSAVGAAWCE